MMVTATVTVLGKSKLSNQDTFDFITGAKKADFNGLNVGEISGGMGVTAMIISAAARGRGIKNNPRNPTTNNQTGG